jgi:hypothetical protein
MKAARYPSDPVIHTEKRKDVSMERRRMCRHLPGKYMGF